LCKDSKNLKTKESNKKAGFVRRSPLFFSLFWFKSSDLNPTRKAGLRPAKHILKPN